MTSRLIVIGAGAAGVGAAYVAQATGTDVTVVSDRAGATELYSGALDDDNRLGAPLPAPLLDGLGWRLAPAPAIAVSRPGWLRAVAGLAAGILDVAPLAGRRIALPRSERHGFDAVALAASLTATEWATRSGTRFSAVDVTLLRNAFEARIGAYDFATLHDEPERLDWLADKLRRASADADAWLLGPWLGVQTAAAAGLQERLGMPVGEQLSAIGEAAGARFEIARDRLFAAWGVERCVGRVVRLRVTDDRVVCELAGGGHLDGSHAVLAIGGVSSGGIELEPRDVDRPGPGFRLACDAPFELRCNGRPLLGPGSVNGFDFVAMGREVFDRVGVASEPRDQRVRERLGAAGAVVADQPRAVVAALRSGVAQAQRLLQVPTGLERRKTPALAVG